ncbi:GNAT family N-acetyltransferase [Rhodobacteraceae bacterium NNCM2]|nr:GNAT family N-acetyltransferase [Coraliihabitans acroporae]
MTTRPLDARDLGWVLDLNRQFETELSPLTAAELERLVGEAFLARVADPEAGFLLTFDQDAAYDSPNFLWFKQRMPRFAYIDRIAISADHRRKGHAEALYRALFEAARAAGHSHVVCEVNAEPPNPASDRFHEALGFQVVGEAVLGDRGKTVRYFSCPLDPVLQD